MSSGERAQLRGRRLEDAGPEGDPATVGSEGAVEAAGNEGDDADEGPVGSEGAEGSPDEPGTALPQPMPVDAAGLKALAHPLRLRMYDLLADGGPATASQLAQQVGESSGTTSYHLRVLAKHGFIEDDPERGDRRDRWWRTRPGGYTLQGSTLLQDPANDPALEVVVDRAWRTSATQLRTWFASATRWDPTWLDATVSTTIRVEATPRELAALRDEVWEVLERHRARLTDREPPGDARRVVVQFHGFPLGEPPEEDRP